MTQGHKGMDKQRVWSMCTYSNTDRYKQQHSNMITLAEIYCRTFLGLVMVMHRHIYRHQTILVTFVVFRFVL